MNIFYDLLILIIKLNLHVLKYFNKKIYEFTEERKNVFDKLKSHISEDKKYIWIHVASLGEYEQGLPIFKKIN